MINSVLPKLADDERNALINRSQGNIDTLRFKYNYADKELKQLAAYFSDVGTDTPSLTVAGMSGEYLYQNKISRFQIDSDGGLLRLPNTFRETAGWQHLLMQADWNHGEAGQLSINQMWCDCNDFQLNATATIQLGAIPYFQINSHINNVDIAQLAGYWPHNVWKPNTIEWLDQGLMAGTVTSARLSAGGEIRTDSFKNGTAFLSAQTRVRNTDVQFNPAWPVVTNLEAAVDITARSIDVEIEKANTEAIDIGPSRVTIPDFSDVEVLAEISADSRDNALLDYLSQSPVADDLKRQEDLELSGRQRVDLSLRIPIVDGPQPLIPPQGQVRFIDGQLQWQDLLLEQLNGLVQVDGFTLRPQQLQAKLAGRDTLVNGAINTRDQGANKININLHGEYSILDWFAVDITPVPMTGISTWQIHLQDKEDAVELIASSDLVGVALNLPPPLQKDADTLKKLTVSCEIPCDQGPVLINYDDQLEAELTASQKNFSVNNIRFGNVNTSSTAQISGQIKQLDLDQWLALAKSWQQSGDATVQQDLLATDIRVKELIFMSRTWADVKLSIKDDVDSVRIDIDSESVKGHLMVANDLQRRGITAEFDSLNWQTADIESMPETAAQDNIPDIHLWAEQFSFAGVPLGRLRMELRNVADGIKVEQLSIKSPLIELNANGEWLRTESGLGTSRFNMVIIQSELLTFYSKWTLMRQYPMPRL
jgi:hypothetical protein